MSTEEKSLQVDLINADTLKKDFSHYVTLDVRNDDEYQSFNLGSLHIPLHELPARIKELDEVNKSTPIVTICAHGVRSAKAAQILVGHGFAQVYSLDGGLADWT